MNKEEIYVKMIDDIRRLCSLKKELPYISGKNQLTSPEVDDLNKVITAKRDGNNHVSVPFEHFKKVSDAFADDESVNVDAVFQGSGNGRAVIETIVAHLPNVGFLPANKMPNVGPKKLVWFDKEVNKLGEVFDAANLMNQRLIINAEFTAESSINLVGKAFDDRVKSCNLRLSKQVSLRFLTSLLTKKFCILTGLAGSGKTKIAEAFAMWLCASPDQYRIVAVGADWTSNENLLGYADALQAGVYRPPVNGVLELILRARADQAQPYFLILDEMNLSHVERYFADFLSAMESTNAPLSLHGVEAGLMSAGADGVTVPSCVALPDNLFIIGTVNVDETTYMFSPKVLDRANVIEFRATAELMDAFLDDPVGIDLVGLVKQGEGFARAFVQRAQADADIATLVDPSGSTLAPRLKADLLQVFAALAGVGAEFGFRSAKEIARFVVLHKELSGPEWQYHDALDAQVVQKLMPKLHGSARKLDGVLKALEDFARDHALALTGEKVKRMQERLARDGFTSFAEA